MAQRAYEGQNTARDIATIVFKHKKKMIITFCATVLIVTVGSLLMAPVYRASSKILVKFGRENVYMPAVPGPTSSPQVLVDPLGAERVNSAVEMVKGQKVVEATIEKLGVKSIYPHLVNLDGSLSVSQSALNDAVRLFQRNLSVQQIRKSNLLEIRFDHPNPVIAAKTVNTLIDTFVEHHVTAYREPRNYDFFKEQVRFLEGKLRASQAEVSTFRTSYDISSLQDQKRTLLTQISDLEVSLAKVKADLAENKGKREALQDSRGSKTGEPRLGKETDYNQQAIAAIRTKITELKLKEAELLNRYSETNTLVINVRKEIEQAEQLLAREEMIYHEKDARSLDQTIRALRQKEAALMEALTASRAKLNSITAVEMRFVDLERQFKLNEENYQLYVRKMEESRISNAMDMEKIANLSVVEPASVPIAPHRPRIGVNIALSTLLGGLLSILVMVTAERFGHTFGKTEDVEKRLGLPVLASIREMEA